MAVGISVTGSSNNICWFLAAHKIGQPARQVACWQRRNKQTRPNVMIGATKEESRDYIR